MGVAISLHAELVVKAKESSFACHQKANVVAICRTVCSFFEYERCKSSTQGLQSKVVFACGYCTMLSDAPCCYLFELCLCASVAQCLLVHGAL